MSTFAVLVTLAVSPILAGCLDVGGEPVAPAADATPEAPRELGVEAQVVAMADGTAVRLMDLLREGVAELRVPAGSPSFGLLLDVEARDWRKLEGFGGTTKWLTFRWDVEGGSENAASYGGLFQVSGSELRSVGHGIGSGGTSGGFGVGTKSPESGKFLLVIATDDAPTDLKVRLKLIDSLREKIEGEGTPIVPDILGDGTGLGIHIDFHTLTFDLSYSHGFDVQDGRSTPVAGVDQSGRTTISANHPVGSAGVTMSGGWYSLSAGVVAWEHTVTLDGANGAHAGTLVGHPAPVGALNTAFTFLNWPFETGSATRFVVDGGPAVWEGFLLTAVTLPLDVSGLGLVWESNAHHYGGVPAAVGLHGASPVLAIGPGARVQEGVALACSGC